MKFKKSIAMAMSVLMAAGMLAGCGSNGSTSSSTASGSASSASGEVSTDGVTISIFDKNSGSNTFDDPVAKAIEEKTGVKIQVENPTGDPLEKLNLMLTGQLGDVMKESAHAAMSYVRSRADVLGIDSKFYKNKDIHIHCPEGAVPKDGPSAGVTMTTALVSALTGAPVRRDVAMTGEVTLRGRVLPIGGLKEKSMAAYIRGIKTVIIPKANVPDLDEVDDAVKANVEFVPVSHVDEVLSIALLPVSKPAEVVDAQKRERAALGAVFHRLMGAGDDLFRRLARQMTLRELVHIPAGTHTTVIRCAHQLLIREVDHELSGLPQERIGIPLRPHGNVRHRRVGAHRSRPCHRDNIGIALPVSHRHHHRR